MAALRCQRSNILKSLRYRSALAIRPVSIRQASTFSASRSSGRTAFYGSLFAVSASLFCVYYFDARSAIHRYVFTPILRYTFNAETSHKIAVKVLRSGLAPRDPVADDERLQSEFLDQKLDNPIGLAAGFDKDGEAIDGLLNLGFSWVEIGSVTPKPQPGNPHPRVFHLPDDAAVINCYGFPSDGSVSVLTRLRARIPKFLHVDENLTAALRPGAVLAVNLGKNKTSPADSVEDFVSGVWTFGPFADVLVVNVSSPNTPGLRGLQNRELLQNLLQQVTEARDALPPSPITSRRPRLVVKLAPDLEELQAVEIAEVIRHSGVDGVIVSNTTIARPSSLLDVNKAEAGGLSGTPLKPYALRAIKILRSNLPARIPIIGCGGISTGADVLEYGRAGATLVQVYTSFGYDGVGTCRRIKDELAGLLVAEGTTWREVTQQAVEMLSLQKEPERDGTIGKLIEEANELQDLLDKLSEKLEGGGQQDSNLVQDIGRSALGVAAIVSS